MNTLLTVMAMQYLNVPYKWGGNNYLGLDCSGLVIRALHDAGLTLTDMTANGLYEYSLRKGTSTDQAKIDSLIFFGTPDKIKHIAISLGVIDGEWLMVEAAGAGKDSLEMTKLELAQRDARVRIKPVSNRSDLVASITIPYRKEIL